MKVKVLSFVFLSLFLPLKSFSADSLEEPSKDLKGEVLQVVTTPRIVQEGEGEEALIEGLLILPWGADLKNIRREHGVFIELPNKENDPELSSLLLKYMNAPLVSETLQQIKRTIVEFFREKKGAYIAVIIPVQQVVEGVVVFEILEGCLGEITYRGQRWFNVDSLKRALPVKTGDPLIETVLLNYVSWLNKNPFHHVEVVLEPGATPKTIDLEFVSKERFIVRFFSGADNTGFQANAQTRLYAGFNWGNAFFRGDLLSYQYTASPNFHTFQSHVFSYTSYLSQMHELTLFGCYGSVFPNISGFTTSGKNVQLSARYEIPFKPLYGDFRSTFSAGFDWKYLTSNLFYAGNPAELLRAEQMNQKINVTQFLFDFLFFKKWRNDVLNGDIELTASVWKDWLPFQTPLDYNDSREGSSVRYGYLSLTASHEHEFSSEWLFSTRFRGQLAGNTLPTSEQFGLGGADTVRGYFEQQFVADNAICLNLELYSPPLSLFEASPNELTFLLFGDYGYGRNYSYISPSYKQQHLVGIGPGVHYDIMPYSSLKVEYGFQLKGIPQDHRFGRFHLSLVASY